MQYLYNKKLLYMSGILNYNKGLFSTQEFRDSLLSRNLPPPVNETLTQSGLVSKLQDIGNVISVPIFGTESENIPVHYNENERMFPLGTFFRNTKNVNLNSYIPQNDEYITYELTVPPNLGFPLPEGFGDKERLPYPTSYSIDRFNLINNGDQKGVRFPFNVIDSFKSLNFQRETSLGLIGGQELETSIINKIAQIEEESNPNISSTGFITPPIGNMVDNYVNILRGNDQFFNTLPNDAVGWNEYNTSNKSPEGLPDTQEGVNPTMSTEIRMKSLFERTSVTQIQFTFDLLNRNKYRPLYEDRRLQGTSDEGTNARYYIGTEKNTNRGSLITKTFSSSDFNGEVDTTGNEQRTTIEGIGEPFGEPNKFFWTTGGEQNFNPKTLLYKTQQLVNNNDNDVFINQTKKFFKDKKQDRLISRGNAISEIELFDAFSNGSFCRVWTVNDRYSYLRAIRNTGLFTSPNGTQGFSTTSEKSSLSVLMDNGIPKYHPTILDSSTTRKKFMFSIENLAWADNLADLPISEVGPGDVLSGNKGRIMWFPPYGLTFDESSNANWISNEFIGRGEPVYTYNNASRSASISFKILVDHPRVLNGYRGKSNNLLERFFAGCVTPENLLSSLDSSVSQNTKSEIEKKLKEKRAQKTNNTLNKKGGPKTIGYLDGVYDTSQYNQVVSDIQSFLNEQATTSDPKVKITVNGYSKDPNGKSTAKEYANQIKGLLKGELGTKNIKYVTNAVVADTEQVEVIWNVDVNNSQSTQPKEEEKTDAAGTYDPEEVKIIDSILIDENAYFDFIDGNYPNYFKTISEKIKYFHPGFHSITPEGLNSRLTFLNQCMRQGPSIYDNNDDIRPQNLSFGRPPICILRIGDFFHTKMKINSLSISYDGPQFDLNPEGIGVQPMIATIQLSIDLIGGHSLAGPINRLQNAISFNYYANTEIYDVRADSIKEGSLVEGVKLGELRRELLGDTAVDALVNDLKSEGTVKQEKDSNNEGDDADGNGDDVIDITVSNNEIKISTKNGDLPKDIVIGKDPNPSNKLGWNIDNITGEDKSSETTENNVSITIDFEKNNLINPAQLKTLEDFQVTLKNELEVAKNNFKTFKTDANKKAYEKAEKDYKEGEKGLNDYKKGKKDSIKVTAFLTENKSKTKKVKTFTITKDGLN